jgi:hypothetical protein
MVNHGAAPALPRGGAPPVIPAEAGSGGGPRLARTVEIGRTLSNRERELRMLGPMIRPRARATVPPSRRPVATLFKEKARRREGTR